MLKKIIFQIIIICIVFYTGFFYARYDKSNYFYDKNYSLYPVKEIIPDSIIAIKIVQTVLLPKFGSEIYNHNFKAFLINDSVWQVTYISNEEFGGNIEIDINKYNCQFLKFNFEK
jgi:hypothetical protein